MTQQTYVTKVSKKPIYCRNECGTEITFDSRKSKSGKSIPIDVGSGLSHQCPKSAYALSHNTSASSTGPNGQEQEIEQEIKQDILNEILYQISELRKEVKELKGNS
jgi:hypothetical protein